MTTFAKLFILAIICAAGIIIGSTIKHDPAPPVKPHIFNLEEPIITFDDKWELIPEATRLRGHYPAENELYDCEGNIKDFGDCAISPDIPIDPYAEVKTEVLIWKPGVGWIEGRHRINDVTAPWKRNMIDLYVPNKMIASILTCDDVRVYRRRR